MKYDDKRAILTAWSAEAGRVAIMIPDGGSREARRRRAMLMPMSLFEGEVDMRPGREILSMRVMRPSAVLPDLSMHPEKSVVAMFLAEVLERILREAAPDPVLTAYIFDAVAALDALPVGRAVANFTIIFLYRLGHFIGITPDVESWRPGYVFDMQAGHFRATPPVRGRWLPPDEAEFLVTLARLDFANAQHVALPLELRRRALRAILDYYTIHHSSLVDLKSLPVVSEIF